MNLAHSAPFRLIVIATLISIIARTLVNVTLSANGFQEWFWLFDTVLSCSFAYLVHWATLNNIRDIRLVISIPSTEINLKRVLSFSLKLIGLTLIAVVPILVMVVIFTPFVEEAALRGQTFAGRIIYIICTIIFIGAAVGYWGTWLPATVAGRNAGFKAAAVRGKASFARNAPLISAIILAQTIFFQIAIFVFCYFAGLDSAMKVPAFEDIRFMAAFEFLTGLVNFAAYAAIAVILCQSYKDTEGVLEGQPVPAA
jgi:hypothetical protein